MIIERKQLLPPFASSAVATRQSTMARAPADRSEPESPPEQSTDTSAGSAPKIVFVDENEKRGRRVEQRVKSDVTFEVFTSPTEALPALDQSLSVLVTAVTFDQEDIEMVVYTARGRAPFSHVGLLARDMAAIGELDVPYDEALTSPLPWPEFVKTLESLFVRSQYLAGLQRYYKQSLALTNRRLGLSGTDPESDEKYQAIEAELERLEGRLDALFEHFSSADYRSVMSRIQEGHDGHISDGQAVTDPNIFGLPEECPGCGLNWGVWHGPALGHGFARIAANVWRCTECDHVIDNPEPSHRHITHR